jgi:hypothetical protein
MQNSTRTSSTTYDPTEDIGVVELSSVPDATIMKLPPEGTMERLAEEGKLHTSQRVPEEV